MSSIYLRDKDGGITTIIDCADVYSYGGFTFEVPTGCYCPMKLRKDGSEAKRCGRKFWKAFSEWDKLSKEEKEATRV